MKKEHLREQCRVGGSRPQEPHHTLHSPHGSKSHVRSTSDDSVGTVHPRDTPGPPGEAEGRNPIEQPFHHHHQQQGTTKINHSDSHPPSLLHLRFPILRPHLLDSVSESAVHTFHPKTARKEPWETSGRASSSRAGPPRHSSTDPHRNSHCVRLFFFPSAPNRNTPQIIRK